MWHVNIVQISFLFFVFSVLWLCVLCVCVFVWTNVLYLHWICEPGIQPCVSVLDTGAFRGVFGVSFCQKVKCTTCIWVCKTQAASLWLSHPCPLTALKKMTTLSCYHSTMTEHKVIPDHECNIPLRHVHKNDFFLSFPLSFSSDELYDCRLLYLPLVILEWCN